MFNRTLQLRLVKADPKPRTTNETVVTHKVTQISPEQLAAGARGTVIFLATTYVAVHGAVTAIDVIKETALITANAKIK